METTDNAPMSDEQAAAELLQPIETDVEEDTEQETEAEPQTEPVEAETDDDASDVVDDDNSEDEPLEAESEEDEQDEDDDTTPEANEQADPLHDVKVNGQERKVGLQELKNDFAGRAALQERHETLKAQEAQIQDVAQSLLQLQQQVNERGFMPEPQKPDPSLSREDPIAYIEAVGLYEQQMEGYTQQQGQLQQIQAQQDQQSQQAQQEFAQAESVKLVEAFPELTDPAKGKAFFEGVTSAAQNYGYSEQEVRQVMDSRAIKVLRDAQRWQDLQAGKEAAKQPKEAPKTVTRPKAKSRNGRADFSKRLQRATETQSDADFAALLLDPNQ